MRSWIEISRSAIRDNFRAVKASVGAVEVMPVVKADAYRHGAIEVSRILEAEGARWLAVSNVEEGIALRENRRYVLYLKPDPADRLGAMRGPGEGYSDTILRLVKLETSRS